LSFQGLGQRSGAINRGPVPGQIVTSEVGERVSTEDIKMRLEQDNDYYENTYSSN